MIPSMPRIRIPGHLAACLGVMLFVSCATPTGMCGCPPAQSAAVIYGRVTDVAGAPVQRARVTAQFGIESCEPHPETLGQATTGADGRYRAHLLTAMGPRPGNCLRAFATPPPSAALRGSDTVTFSVSWATERVVDSARVDLVLRAP